MQALTVNFLVQTLKYTITVQKMKVRLAVVAVYTAKNVEGFGPT